jgi:predicted Fe-S protein YdhL (DUF1289 family)
MQEHNKLAHMNTSKSPCVNLCRYIEIEVFDAPLCSGCGRTYDDLEHWTTLSSAERKIRAKAAKANLKKLSKI